MWFRKLGFVSTFAAALVLAACGGEDAVEEEAVDVAEPVGETAVAPTEGVGFEQWDTDRSGTLAENEFIGAFRDRGVFTRWNANADTGVDAGELGTGALGIWDTDDNNLVAENEWNEGVRGWFGAGENFGTFADWDLNRDAGLDAAELGAGFERTGLFGEWDANDDAFLDENEFGAGAFRAWDLNDDNLLDTNEWGGETADWGIV